MRDPRLDPQTGDVVRARETGTVRTVIEVNRSADQPSVLFETERMGVRGKRREGLMKWRLWCARNA